VERECWLVCGLGNPGPRYKDTRHNIGFLALERFARDCGADLAFRVDRDASVLTVDIPHKRLILVMPQSFMNNSGEPVQRLAGFYKVPLERIVVLHDELDIPLGSIRVKQGGGAGGHNGVRSVDQMMGSADFYRVRVGIGRPPPPLDSASWVLGMFNAEERPLVEGLCERASQATKILVNEGLIRAQNLFNS
jgi:PTH1 family peptidyl-tRNA hydrolase